MNNNIKYKYRVLILFLAAAFITFGFLGDNKDGIKKPSPVYKLSETMESGKNGDAYALNINNVYMPLNRKGVIADVNVPPPNGNGSLGQFAGQGFLFSSGFFLSGYYNGQLWANAVASATLVEDYVQGSIAGGQNDPNAVLYVLNSQDVYVQEGGVWVPHQSWIDWKDAVNLGADFYDGDGDNEYNPQDKNQNGEWDLDEDRPDLIGDETVWCVYRDGLPVAQRRWNTSIEVGLEVRQSVFAFASAGAIGNLIFVRYRFKYVGLGQGNEPDNLTDVYFGVWADPDVGDADDDLVGSDVPRNAGYTYNNGPDPLYGNTPPCFMIDFFSGPVVYIEGETYLEVGGDPNAYDDGIDTPLDTAFSVRGQVKGVVEFPGAKNLPISSFIEYRNGDQLLNDPSNINEARNYMLGFDKEGNPVDPCTFSYGTQNYPGCETVDPNFWFSGDPVTGTGWINNSEIDQRQMINVGPFVLTKNDEKEIVVAYVVNNGSDPLDAITQTRRIDDGAQNIFDLNFLAPSPPPAPRVTITSGEDFLDISWNTPNQIVYTNTTPTWDLKFQGYQVWAFRTNINQDVIAGQQNSKLITSFSADNFIKNIYKENGETGGIELLYPEPDSVNKLDYDIYSDPVTGRIRLRLFNDPFNANESLVKGTPYYFAVTSYAINYDALVYKDDPSEPVGTEGDYYLSALAFAQEAENVRGIQTVVMGENLYRPPVEVQPATRIAGHSTGEAGYDVVNIDELGSNQYEITFYRDSASVLYSMYWRMKNITTNTELISGSKTYSFGETSVADTVIEGFIPRVKDITATLGTPVYTPSNAVWYDAFSLTTSGTGVTYVGEDLENNNVNVGVPVGFPGGRKSNVITAKDIRRVELRFGTQGKAYRYLNGYKGSALARGNSFSYAAGVTAADTVGRGVVGNWDTQNDRPNGFVDVPFTAWLVDPTFSEDEIQLAVGFLEASSRTNQGLPSGGNPDGVWDPGDSIRISREYIYIFNSPYDPNGQQIEFTGGDFNTPGGPVTAWADLIKASAIFVQPIPPDAIGITEEQRRIYNSSYFNAMYAVGLQRRDANSFFTAGDVLEIPVTVYPYTEEDVYQFRTSPNTITSEQEKQLWDKVNVFPNPLFGFNPLTSYTGTNPDEPYVTFTNLPTEVTVKIYSLSGSLIKTLDEGDKSGPTSPFLQWNLLNESGLRVASGMYLAIVSSPKFGDKVLKFAIIMPQKQIQRY